MAYYFPSSQSHALQYVHNLLQILTNKLSDFSAFDSERFVAQFLVDFAEAIKAVEDINDDESVRNEQINKTELIEHIMAQARRQFQGLKYFVEKTFPNDVNTWNKFGFEEYNKIRVNAVKMIPFLLKVYKIADENRLALNLQDCTNNYINTFDNLYKDLVNAVAEQNISKNDRLIITQKRREALDNLFDKFVTPTREVAKLIYADNPAMYMQFLLPKRSSTTVK